MSDQTNQNELLALTAEIVAAHVGNNLVPVSELPTLINDIYRTLASVGTAVPVVERPQPAVPVKKSVAPDYIICLEDGKKLKMLKRHLQTSYGLTPAGYRARWGLPPNYPMVAPDYAERRSALAKSYGLGRKRTGPWPDVARGLRKAVG